MRTWRGLTGMWRGLTGMRGGRGLRRSTTSVAIALAMALVVSGCASLPFGSDQSDEVQPQTPVPTQVQTPPAGQADLARFYTQQLTWRRCASFQCSRLTVPVDYAAPGGATIALALLKAPATSRSERIGALVVNPGGPGASGIAYAAGADLIVSSAVRKAYDIVGFDPRGVGSSAPITCLGDRQLDTFLGQDPTPDDAVERQALADAARDFAGQCAARGGPLLAHVSTVDAAKDMDILRSALGEARLAYLGKSYGTFLGATYADLFPRNVGRFVLDGAIAPDLSADQVNLGQAVGFETATRAYVQDCVHEADCPLGDSLDAGMQKLRDFLKDIDARPIRVEDSHVAVLTEGWGSMGIGAAMYNQEWWGDLTDALREAFDGDGTKLMALAGRYAFRDRDGSYDGNLMQVIYAVNCLDRADNGDLARHAAHAQELARSAPTWGNFLAWGSLPCGFWPVKAKNEPMKITAAGSGPIVVVGTTRDPATPYEWAKQLAGELAGGHLITYDGDGHTAYKRSNSCVDNAVDAYLLKGTVPRTGLRC